VHKDTEAYPHSNSVWFLETKRFTALWGNLRLNAEDLIDLQNQIMFAPFANPVIAGTGGLRKMRFSSRRIGNKGKRGSFRVCYAYLVKYSAIVLILVYPKAEMDNLTAEDKKAVKLLLSKLEKEFESRFGNE
jgi:hypothetical protein